MRMRRDRRLEKLLRGLRKMGRYSAPAVIAALPGCVLPPNLVHVSNDGRYIVAPYTSEGVNLRLGQSAAVVVIDLKTGKARVMDDDAPMAFWFASAKGTTAYMAYREAQDEPELRIAHQGGRVETIPGGAFPAISDDGRWLVYTAAVEKVESGLLMRRDLTSGEETDLGLWGAMADIAPNGGRLSYLTRVEDEDAPDDAGRWELRVARMDGSDERTLAELDADTDGTFYPRWLDNERLVYRTRTDASPDDPELFITDLQGNRQRLTDNTAEDAHAHFLDENRMVYLQRRPNGGNNPDRWVGEVWLAERKEGRWEHRSLEIDAFYVTVRNGQIAYVGPRGERGSINKGRFELYLAPVDNPGEARNLGELVRKSINDLPERKQ